MHFSSGIPHLMPFNKSVILNEVKDLMKEYFVYIMSNWNNKVIYIGVTNNLERRIYEHKNKLIEGFTKKYNLTKLVYWESFKEIKYAVSAEKNSKDFLEVKRMLL